MNPLKYPSSASQVISLLKILQAWLYTQLHWPWQQIAQTEVKHDLVEGENLLDIYGCMLISSLILIASDNTLILCGLYPSNQIFQTNREMKFMLQTKWNVKLKMFYWVLRSIAANEADYLPGLFVPVCECANVDAF